MQTHPVDTCLICSSCSSDQSFAADFLQIPPRDGHPCPWLTVGTINPRIGLAPTSKRPCWAHIRKKPSGKPESSVSNVVRERGLEPPHLAAPDPKSGASAIPPFPPMKLLAQGTLLLVSSQVHKYYYKPL